MDGLKNENFKPRLPLLLFHLAITGINNTKDSILIGRKPI